MNANANEQEDEDFVAEIYRVKEELSARFNHDVRAMLADAHERALADGRPLWTRDPVTGELRPVPTGKAADALL